jgi:hypothetical protein
MKCYIPRYNVAYCYIIYEHNGYGKTKLKHYKVPKQHIYDFKAICNENHVHGQKQF